MIPQPERYDYDRLGTGYAGHRRTDPRIARFVHAALGPARTVLNVGAGAGSYEPTDRYVLAVEPSSTMRAQRPPHLSPAIIGNAGALPFDEGSVDAAMAMVTVHHWPSPLNGLRELRRVARGPVVVFTFDPEAVAGFWLSDYAPEMVAADKMRYPTIDFIIQALGGHSKVEAIPVPQDCVDGFIEAFYARPEAFLDGAVRRSQSVWKFLPRGVEERIVRELARDLASGAWEQRYGELRSRPDLTCALRLITAYP